MKNRKRNGAIAIVLAALLATSALAIGLGGTLAVKPDLTVELERKNTYPTFAVGATEVRGTVGGRRVNSAVTAVATASINAATGDVTMTGVKAGVAYITVGSGNGNQLPWQYQVTDSTKISEYTLRKGGEVFLKAAGSVAAANTYIATVPTAAVSGIAWRSLQTDIATVNEATGLITAVAKGSAIVVGTFTDKWGIDRDLHILVMVGIANGRLGELLELITKGEGILEYEHDAFTTDSLRDLKDEVINGNNVVNNPNPSDTLIDDAIDRLLEALENLEPRDQTPAGIIGPDQNGDYYRPVGDPDNVYELVNKDGSSKHQPPKYIYDPNGSLKNKPPVLDGDEVPAIKGDGINSGFFWVEDPENIWHKVNSDGTLSDDNVLWGGPDGLPTGSDNLPAKKFGNEWWIDRGQNVWQKYDPSNPRGPLGPLTGGGPDDDPTTGPVTPIFPGNNNGLPFTDGKYYIGPIDPGPNEYYIGDKPFPAGDGKLNSTLDYLDDTDCIYWLVGGNMVTTPPVGPDDPEPADGDRVLGTDKTGDSSEWIEIARSGGYSLIIRRNYINTYEGSGTSHAGQPDWQHVNYGTSDTYKTPTSSGVRNAINKWFKGTATNYADKLPLDARLRNYTMSNNASDLPGTANEGSSLTNAFSKPTTYQDGMNDDIAFALSASEAIKFCSKQYRINSNKAGDSSAQAQAKFNKLNIPANGTYNGSYYSFGVWLRSKGTLMDGGKTGGIINGNDGDVFQFHLNHGTPTGNTESGLLYPALWVKSTIFTDPVVNIPANGGSFTDNKGVTWIVLTTDGEGNKLLMTDYVYMEAPDGPKYVTSGNYVAYESSNLKTAMENWFSTNAGSDIKGIARGYTTPLPTGKSQASGTAGTGKPFPLSQDEFDSFVPAGKKKGVGYPSGYSGRDWYLRGGSGSSVNMVNSQGNVASCTVGVNTTGIRPCIWVKP